MTSIGSITATAPRGTYAVTTVPNLLGIPLQVSNTVGSSVPFGNLSTNATVPNIQLLFGYQYDVTVTLNSTSTNTGSLNVRLNSSVIAPYSGSINVSSLRYVPTDTKGSLLNLEVSSLVNGGAVTIVNAIISVTAYPLANSPILFAYFLQAFQNLWEAVRQRLTFFEWRTFRRSMCTSSWNASKERCEPCEQNRNPHRSHHRHRP